MSNFDEERKIIVEFCHILEKSKQLFNGLRELPPYGHKQWHAYFGRTFDVYTKLWKFQQKHRALLDAKYGLKRWQIGEIASKIGQLYYHFYLRTSETTYLNEAFAFYYAIRGRCYYTKANQEDKCELMVKKLRYYARFIAVCLLLKKIKLVKELINELERHIVEYGNSYDPNDQLEWTVVVDEVKAFIHAEPVVSVIHPDNYPVTLSYRLSPLTTPPVERSHQMNLTLQQILIIGSSSQVKFSELTMDMFRMLQTLEREPSGDPQQMFDGSPRQRFISTPSVANPVFGDSRRENPHKYLLYRPTPNQVLVYMSTSCHELAGGGVILLYISAEGYTVNACKSNENGYDMGGVITSKIENNSSTWELKIPSKNKDNQCLYPGDLYGFCRSPLFIIIDSDNSYVFQYMPRHFGQPLIVFMSPVQIPAPFQENQKRGSLFTLFLHSPLTALCYICDIVSMPLVQWNSAQVFIEAFMAEASQILTSSRIDSSYIAFMGDDYLRLLIIRYLFCNCCMRVHRAFRAKSHLPRASPPIPEELLESPSLANIVLDLTAHLQIRKYFITARDED